MLTTLDDYVLLDLFVCLRLEGLLIAMFDSLGMCCLINYFVALKETSDFLINELLAGLTPARWSPKFFDVLGAIAGRWPAMTCCGC